jgi:arylsulfatase A-like enzyme
MPTLPNILYLNTHDTGRHIGTLGAACATPHLDRLAEGGVRFRNCHCAGPTCSPSRAALLTGMLPHSCGMLGLAHRGFAWKDDSWHLAHHLRGHGYATAAWNMPSNHCTRVGKDEAAAAQAVGYDAWLGHDLAALTGFLAAAPKQPFFLSASWTLTHRIGRGFTTPADPARIDPRRVQPPPVLPDGERQRADWAHFLNDVETWDGQLGQVLETLDAAGLAGNTLVIATTDHGVPFPGMKCSPTVHGTGVFLVMRGPGGFAGGLALDQLVSHIDLFPTICAIAGLPVPDRVQGVDLRPVLKGQPVRDHAVAEVTWHAAYEPVRAYRTDRFLYVRRFGERRGPVLPNCDESPSKDAWLEAGWAFRAHGDEELYDTVFDPQERRSLAADPLYAATLRDLRARLDAHMRRTDDPLLHGDPALPPGATTTCIDEVRPDGPRMQHG